MKRWTIGLGFLVSAIFVYLALQGLHLEEVWRRIQEADYRWFVPALLGYFVGVWARAWRWHYMLRPLKAIPLRRLFPVAVIGYMGNNVYPARAGELIRAYVLRRKEQVTMSSSLATIVVERVFDGLVMLLFVFVSLSLTPLPVWLQRMVILASVLFFAALFAFFGLAAAPRRAQAATSWFVERLLPSSLREPVEGIVDRFLAGLRFLLRGRDVGLVFAISIGIWLAETVVYWCIMQGFPFRVRFHVLMLMSGVANLATIIPSSPGYVGTFDMAGIRVLEGFGVPGEAAASYTLLLHAGLWLPITCLGFYYMWRESISWRDFAVASEGRIQMNFKAIFLGVISTVVTAFIVGFGIGLYGGASGQDPLWFLASHRDLIYVMNIISGLVGGWVTFALGKEHLVVNLLVMSTTVFFLSVLFNIPMMGPQVSLGALLTPLAVGWITPFVFSLFKHRNAQQ